MSSSSTNGKANIAVIGAGWWSQGWHIPHLHRHPSVDLVAIVDASPHPKSNLNPDLESLEALASKYNTATFSSTTELLEHPVIGAQLNGVVVATPHATHYAIGEEILRANQERKNRNLHQIHVLMEKPLTTNVHEAKKLHDMVVATSASSNSSGDDGIFFGINHSANYRAQAIKAREIIESGTIGTVRHVTAFLASALCWIFEDPANSGWNKPVAGMLGNGFAWGQSSHLLAWIYHVCGDELQPKQVFCAMNHSPVTGADVSHSATVICSNGSSEDDDCIMSLSGTSLLPGNEHSDPPVGKQVRIEIYGTKGAIIYSGKAGEPTSARLELRRAPDGETEYPFGADVGFEFENLDIEGTGPESLEAFVAACCSKDDYYVGADSLVGLRSIQTLEAMYRSNHTKMLEKVEYS